MKHAGLRGALLALPLIALGGYSIVAAGAGFTVVRWIKISALVVYLGTAVLHVGVERFAAVNVALTCEWILVALRIAPGRSRAGVTSDRRGAGHS